MLIIIEVSLIKRFDYCFKDCNTYIFNIDLSILYIITIKEKNAFI